MRGTEVIPTSEADQDGLYREAAEKYGSALVRLALAYEADPEKRRDLLQEIHLQLWRSFQRFDARCSLRTWVYRVAHYVATSHVIRERRIFSALVSLEELETLPGKDQGEFAADQRLVRNNGVGIFPKMAPFLIMVMIWIGGVFIIRMRQQQELQREIDDLKEIERQAKGCR